MIFILTMITLIVLTIMSVTYEADTVIFVDEDYAELEDEEDEALYYVILTDYEVYECK